MYFIDSPDRDNTISKQLKKLTGDVFSKSEFESAHDPSQTTPAGVLIHKKTGKQVFIPFKADVNEDGEDRCVEELRRLALFHEGCGGYQWGDTRNRDGNFGGVRLDMLEEFGLAERTGRSVPNHMGGSWPEVQVTDLGMQVIEGERQKIGRNLSTRKLLDEALIPKSILVAAEIARSELGPEYDSEITLFDILKSVEHVWKEMKNADSSLKNVSFEQGVGWLQGNLEDFANTHKEYSRGSERDTSTLIPISPSWNKEVGTQVKVMAFKDTGKFYNDGIVNLPGAKSYDRESVLKAFRENQKILAEDFYKSPYTLVLEDTPVNSADPLYREFFTRMTQAEDFNPNPKLNQKNDLDNFSP